MKTLLWNFSWRIIRNTLCYSCCVTVYFVNVWLFKYNKYEENRLVVSYSTIKDEFTKQLTDVKYGDSFAYFVYKQPNNRGSKKEIKKQKRKVTSLNTIETLRYAGTEHLIWNPCKSRAFCSMHWSIAVRAIHERRMDQSRSRDRNLLPPFHGGCSRVGRCSHVYWRRVSIPFLGYRVIVLREHWWRISKCVRWLVVVNRHWSIVVNRQGPMLIVSVNLLPMHRHLQLFTSGGGSTVKSPVGVVFYFRTEYSLIWRDALKRRQHGVSLDMRRDHALVRRRTFPSGLVDEWYRNWLVKGSSYLTNSMIGFTTHMLGSHCWSRRRVTRHFTEILGTPRVSYTFHDTTLRPRLAHYTDISPLLCFLNPCLRLCRCIKAFSLIKKAFPLSPAYRSFPRLPPGWNVRCCPINSSLGPMWSVRRIGTHITCGRSRRRALGSCPGLLQGNQLCRRRNG